MKKYILSILVAAMALVAQAQDVENSYPVATVQPTAATVGYFSYKDVLESMPEYAIAGRQLSDLRAKLRTSSTPSMRSSLKVRRIFHLRY